MSGLVWAAGLGLVGAGEPAAAEPAAAEPAAADANRQELRTLAEEAGRELEGAPALEVVRWAVERFGDRFCVTSSMADAVLVHLVSRVAPGVDVVFLDTGLHFPETLRVRDQVSRTMPVNVRSIRPRLTVGQQDGEYGPRLFHRSPDDCCQLRKVESLERALVGYDAWATGLRRDDSPSRANTPVVTFDTRRGKVKVNPIAAWTQADVETYISQWDVPVNELFGRAYSSVGCWPCTRRTRAGEDARAGRWAMFEKAECGLHG